MNHFYQESQLKNKAKLVIEAIERNNINYVFILLPVINKELKKQWKNLCYDLGIDVIIMSFKQYINHRNKNNFFLKFNKIIL